MRLKKILASLLFIGIFLVLIWKLNILSVEKVMIYSNAECVSEQDLKRELNIFGKNLLSLNQNRIKNDLAVKYLCIKDIDISYEFPRTIKVIVYGRKFLTKVVSFPQINNLPDLESSTSSETALLDWNFPSVSSEEAFIADNAGFIFTKKQPNFSLPTLLLTENLVLGKQMDKKFFNSLDQIFTKCLQLEPMSGEPNFIAKKYGNILQINTSVKLVFSLERDILRQLASLQLILQKAKIDGRIAQVIDLRFDKPIVEYQPKLSK